MNTSKKKILVVPGNTDLNRGDQALIWESIRLLEDIYTNLEVYLYESGASDKERELQKAQTKSKGFIFLTRILLHPRVKANINKKMSDEVKYSKLVYIKWGIIAFLDFISTMLLIIPNSFINKLGRCFLTIEQKKSLDIFQSLDAVIVKGGGFLHSYGKLHDPFVMYYFLFDLMLAHRHKVKVIILPNSIGPLKNRIARTLVKRVISKSVFISVREDVSYQFLKNVLNISSKKYPDLGFFLKSYETDLLPYLINKGFIKEKKNIAITLRPYRFDGFVNADRLYNSYLTEMSNFVSHQIDKGYDVTLMAHTLGPSAHEDDRLALNEVYHFLSDKYKKSIIYLEDFELDCRQIQKLYSYYDLVIGTRFHSVIFALNENTPSIAIAYGGNKSYGIMQDIGLPEYVIGIEKVTSFELDLLVEKLESEKAYYIDKVRRYQNLLEKNRIELINSIKIVVR
ncbi:MAG TPA: polysaccharide pyruvyl transferase family protein [Saprospiraceae bacterium]|nr:polysaccharide pyruvyl transferase family protein [Saprospiraceae bacterium]